MGGQETLLLVARHPGMLAGAAAFDADANLARRYRDFPLLRYGRFLQWAVRREVGGTPWRTHGPTLAAVHWTMRRRSRAPACRSSSGGAHEIGSSSTRRGRLDFSIAG